ncbi:MAG: hypothetical protein WCX73_02655 [Candidatus Pacearchaeota archaeon]|jgi:hypothetical protein
MDENSNEKKKLCVKATKFILEKIEDKWPEDSIFVAYTGDWSSIVKSKYKQHGYASLARIKNRFKKHISECLDCRVAYIDFLENKVSSEKTGSIENLNKDYLKVSKKYLKKVRTN